MPTKAARARERERLKADNALGGAKLAEEVSGQVKMGHRELQWFRLLHGQSRLNQIARILVELAPQNVFNPLQIYETHLAEEKSNEVNFKSTDKKSKKKKKEKKMSKKEMIIAKNTARKEKQDAERDAEKLSNLGQSSGNGLKLKTESGRYLLLLEILKKSVSKQDIVDILDTLWEIEEVSRTLSPSLKSAVEKSMKKYSRELIKATDIRKHISDYFDYFKERAFSPLLEPKNIYDFQLSFMSDRLPPLSLHTLKGKFKFDPWQLRVLDLLTNKKKSVLICAPTSCGKTVLSTYLCQQNKRALFCVPTEPLAWQVAAMLRALKLDVAIVVPSLTFVPNQFSVVVGTPNSLESALTKQIGFDFDYAIYDEVHSLNNKKIGAALQRLIKAISNRNCQILALSATIGNYNEVLEWWESLVGKGRIELVNHRARFINLQRHVWSFPEGASSEDSGKLDRLHPCLSLSVDYLASLRNGEAFDLAFTPQDTFLLFKAMEKILGKKHPRVSELKPRSFFKLAAKVSSEDNEESKDRITLVKSKDYEDKLKDCIKVLAKEDKLSLLKIFALLTPKLHSGDGVEVVKGLITEEEIKAYMDENLFKTIRSSQNEASTTVQSLTSLLFELKRKEMTPVILFQLDSVQCQAYFDKLITELEEMQQKKYPNFYQDLEAKQKQVLKQMKAQASLKSSKNNKQTEEDLAYEYEFGASDNMTVDLDAPHPEFVLAPVGRQIGPVEIKQIKSAISFDLQIKTGKNKAGNTDNQDDHPLIKGLRRGIGLYIQGLPSSYHRVVQKYAQMGRLGVVFSDELLAYGVNMPFRSAVFFNDPGNNMMSVLEHQQMAGRAGRRGLDRQGHLIYAGFSYERLQELLRGTLPSVVGADPLYPTIPLQLYMNKKFVSAGTPLSVDKMKKICATPLEKFIEHKTILNYYESADTWIHKLDILRERENTGYADLIPELVWELRAYLAESLAIEYILEELIREYKGTPVSLTDTDVKEQTEMCLIFSCVCSRKVLIDNEVAEDQEEEYDGPENALPKPHTRSDIWKKWFDLVEESQTRIKESDLENKESILLPSSTEQFYLENGVYSAFIRNQIDPNLKTTEQHELRERLWDLGEVLRLSTNVLGRANELRGLTNLIRKCFLRIRYILDESSQRNWSSL
eukprot:snap_masked-scaffold_1-processed-gene-3.33-mRNA-1 protein AED:0.00 eAED:0.05 QI:0/-1/0/1/-1/1/1/0/1148